MNHFKDYIIVLYVHNSCNIVQLYFISVSTNEPFLSTAQEHHSLTIP